MLAGCVGEVGQGEQLQTAASNDAPEIAAQIPTLDAGAASASAAACPTGQQRAPAAGLRIREVALYQTIKIPLYQNGTWIATRPAPVIQGRTALARVFVDTIAGYRAHPVRGTLTLQNGSAAPTVLTSERTLAGNSTDAALDSTFTFNVAGAQLGPSTQVTFALEEAACGSAASTAVARDVRVPATGAQALGAIATGPLKVVIVPVSVGGRVPSTTPAEVAAFKEALFAYYPVPSVEVSVRTPLVWTSAVAASNGTAWSNVLNRIMRERSADRVASDVYYFGLMQPAATFATFCSRGCILGIAPQTTRVSPSAQVGLGASFSESRNQNLETMVHELGHAHGRGHAPCVQGGSIQGVDTRFPDKSGATAVWGWDNRNNTLYPPTHKDVMGYCRPNWISGYTYAALAARSVAVNRQAYVFAGINPTRWHSLIAYGDGQSRWGGQIETGLQGGDTEPAEVLDAAGQVIKQVDVVRMELSHSEDQFFYIPEPGADWAAVKLRDRKVELSKVQPAL